MGTVENQFLMAAADLAGPAPQGAAGWWAADALRRGIIAGELPPGTKLSEVRVSEALGISRNTLREAFSILGNENLLTRVPNRGVVVARPGADDVREIYRVRLALESSALRWADPAPRPELHAAVEAGRGARGRGDVAGMAGADLRFHGGVVALAGSVRQDRLMSRILAEMRLVFFGMHEDPSFHVPYVERNARILELYETGSPREAAEEMAEYLRAAREQLLGALGTGPRAASGRRVQGTW